MQVSRTIVKDYLSDFLNTKSVEIEYFGTLSGYQSKDAKDIKGLGYGIPYLVVYKVRGKRHQSIISTMRIARGFGHDYRADRVDNLVLSFDTWNKLAKHCKVEDLGALVGSSMISLGKAGEFFILRPKLEGIEYYKDLDRIAEKGIIDSTDRSRAIALAKYLVRIHSNKKGIKDEDREFLYPRKIRDTLGHGECIFGLADSYPLAKLDFLKEGELEEIEKKCVEHRWRLKGRTSRLAQVHGDFHPWNILFSKDPKKRDDFALLDRSRGALGEPADDVCALSINYIFHSLRKYGSLQGEFETLFDDFVGTYLKSNDQEILDAMPLFYVFRALVISSPLWYPSLPSKTRRQIFNFAQNVLDAKRFDPSRVNEYLER